MAAKHGTPFFTVIIPTYNRAELLKEAIRSVLDQTFQDFELIIVDDHSKDNTRELINGIMGPRLTYIVNDHQKGPGGARNAGMERANGKWIAFLDSDDVWLPRKLELLYKKIFESSPETGLIYTGHADYDFENGAELRTVIPQKRGDIQNDLMYKNYIGTFSVAAIRSEVVARIGGIDEAMYMFEDGEFYSRIAGSYKIDFIDEVLTRYRTNNGDKLSSNPGNALMSYRLFWEKHKRMINGDPRLRHRAASRVFAAAFAMGKTDEVMRSLPWTIAGAYVDPRNFLKTIRSVAGSLYRKRLRPALRSSQGLADNHD